MLSPAEFDLIVEEALRRIPKRFRQKIENVAIVVEAEPRQPGLLGTYQGRPLTERSVYDGFGMPDKITIYQGPHERLSHSPEELQQMVADTVWHEIAHYFGMDEKRVRRAERKRGSGSYDDASLSSAWLPTRSTFRIISPAALISKAG